MALAQALLLPNWFSRFASLFAMSVLYIIRKPREEAMMLNLFGLEYESYMRNSGGVFPKMLRHPTSCVRSVSQCVGSATSQLIRS
jgi:protein-S-isoprenylcysteine O-methyltransferase Ste14